MSNDAGHARRALLKFLADNNISQRKLCKASDLSPSAINQFLLGNAQSPKADTYEKMAKGATKLLDREVSLAELRGLKPMTIEIPLRSYIGAGDEILPIPGDGPIDYVSAPPGLEHGEATVVRGRSMLPLYHPGDLLFHRRVDSDPSRWIGEVLAVQVHNGQRFVKLLQKGTRRNRFTLASVNPAFPPLEDQLLDWVGPIEWVDKRGSRRWR